MTYETSRFGLSLFVMIGFWTNFAAADDFLPLPGKHDFPQVMIAPEVPYYIEHHPPYPMPFYPAPPPQPAKHFYQRLLNHLGMNCNANRDTIAGNVFENIHFVFGSSHDFFSEYCAPNQCGRHVP